jgi:hypothetical protein
MSQSKVVTSNKWVGRFGCGDFHLSGSLKKYLTIKRFVLDADVKQAVAFQL